MTALKNSLILTGFSENGPKTRQKMSDSQICQNRAKMTEIEMTDMCDYHQWYWFQMVPEATKSPFIIDRMSNLHKKNYFHFSKVKLE